MNKNKKPTETNPRQGGRNIKKQKQKKTTTHKWCQRDGKGRHLAFFINILVSSGSEIVV